MATQTVEFAAAPEQTITAKLFSPGSDTVVQTASEVTGATNRAGVYSATFTDVAAGLYRLIATNAGGTPLAQWWVDLTLTTATFQSYEVPISVMQSGLSTLDAAGVRSAVGMASADLDTQLSDLPTVAEFEARTLLAAAYFDAAVDSVTVSTNNDKTGYALSSASRDAIVADFLAHVISKGDAGTIERAFWQAAKSQASANGEVSGTPTASAFDTDLTAVTGAFDDLLIRFVSGSLEGEARPIATYSSTDGRITLQKPLTSAPSATDEFLIIPDHSHPIADIQDGLATSAALATVDSNVDTLVARITSTLFDGITSMASWLGALAGKTADASTLAEIQSTTAGATFANSTDSLEAIRDRGDAAWAPGEAGAGDASQSTLLAVQDQVEAIAGTLGGTAISVTSRIADGGSMVIYTGDDLKVRSGTQVTVSISDAAGGIYSRLSAIGTSNLSWGAARPSQAAGAISGTISSITQSGSGDDQVVNLVIEILDAGQSLNPADDYIWQVASTSSSGDEYTEIEGTLDLRRRVAVPVTV